ncbi:MAG: 1,4-alpha-glucan branching protein GlgB [Gemmatimonadetes bacterium]|uniref:1,4-alpha-glucan branching enzyme GlgB n=1 Tax=Candidatus Kutchimonas denitrificans TaxID=3056748 RepID=A0AAE4ZDL8_9BACT|nr:1,4-alpha-glucan branching protein GlgB [Gemmatimonadota bacterium]NIR76615.1 1,4-alpha-glucan branching protein GlgB [Candidatus Kutchimonas denitrificans]NIS03384.1 1,4-alpha-glucan branching protein GlgB [Gemmatimonadota bacterium]NIT69245.1 1,4-alpha-glucan branching protein GlgB [Gemmatimonadota bacterium]NIU54717.1 1,4-alpha-glucan branching protein GlgB [Gemmatimonadota bacterium]
MTENKKKKKRTKPKKEDDKEKRKAGEKKRATAKSGKSKKPTKSARSKSATKVADPLQPDPGDRDRLLDGEHHDPHRLLGAQPVKGGVVIRAFHPDATAAVCLLSDGSGVELRALEGGSGLFGAVIPDLSLPADYRLRFRFEDGATWERDDPYRFRPTVGDMDLHLFNEGTHYQLWRCLGARAMQHDGVEGVAFAVWAPSARRVSVVGDFCGWDGRLYPMRSMGASGIFELFIPELAPGALYKYEIKTSGGDLRVKTDPYATAMEMPPGTASRVYRSSYRWDDGEWLEARRGQDAGREPMAVYEVHLGSWARVPEENDRPLTYREAAPRLVEHMKRFGFTHVEFLPISEHPFTGSWGYQVSGYYAPTARYGTPDDFRYLVDYFHQKGIGVIIDWVPAHFPKDDFALRRFDGTALYEHEDPRLGEHPDWGTLIFNYGRKEVQNFLIANALYWLEEFHIDGLRVDAVASMLYLDYSRKAGEWVPNVYGGRENLEAVAFLKRLNEVIGGEYPGCFTIAEESTAWGAVSRPTYEGGLGFHFKWNMGWMHDTLEFFRRDPVYRHWHLGQLSFAMLYEYSERFVMPLSHDEVVHGKGSLLDRMPGDVWQKFANLRLLLTYQYTRPGKQLLFMGTELAPWREWNHDTSLDWHLAEDPMRATFGHFLEELGAMYTRTPALWRQDHEPAGFDWIECHDRDNSIVSYTRWDGDDHVVVVLNLTPAPRDDYRIGVPVAGNYALRFCSDEKRYGGSDYRLPDNFATEPVAFHGHEQSIRLHVPPLGGIVLVPIS